MQLINFNYPIMIDDVSIKKTIKPKEEIISKEFKPFFEKIKNKLQLFNFKLSDCVEKKLNKKNNGDIDVFTCKDFIFTAVLNNEGENFLEIKAPGYPYNDYDKVNIELLKGRLILSHEALPRLFKIKGRVNFIQCKFYSKQD